MKAYKHDRKEEVNENAPYFTVKKGNNPLTLHIPIFEDVILDFEEGSICLPGIWPDSALGSCFEDITIANKAMKSKQFGNLQIVEIKPIKGPEDLNLDPNDIISIFPLKD